MRLNVKPRRKKKVAIQRENKRDLPLSWTCYKNTINTFWCSWWAIYLNILTIKYVFFFIQIQILTTEIHLCYLVQMYNGHLYPVQAWLFCLIFNKYNKIYYKRPEMCFEIVKICTFKYLKFLHLNIRLNLILISIFEKKSFKTRIHIKDTYTYFQEFCNGKFKRKLYVRKYV